MNTRKAFVGLWVLLTASAAWAQGMSAPQMRGLWQPEVGKGAAYRMDSGKSENGSMEWEFTVVGTEKTPTGPGYWLEMTGQGGPENQQMTIKTLLVVKGEEIDLKRMIMQMAGQPPMEMPVGMMPQGEQAGPEDIRKEAQLVGTETVTVPAGPFQCQHYRKAEAGNNYDVWVSVKVVPYGLVKAVYPEGTMVLLRLITDAKSRIVGEPKRFDPMEMMRRMPGRE